MSKAFSLIQEAMTIFSENDPSSERSLKVSRQVETAVFCYKQLYKDKKESAKQTSLDSFFIFPNNAAAPNVQICTQSIPDDSSAAGSSDCSGNSKYDIIE